MSNGKKKKRQEGDFGMFSQQKLIRRYSLAFKAQVVQDIESGRLTAAEAAKVYDIAGHSTIQKWLAQFASQQSKNRVVRIESPDEARKILALKQEKRQLETALAQSQLKIRVLETIIEKADEHYQDDLKKNFGTKV
jgi:transposase-like protein